MFSPSCPAIDGCAILILTRLAAASWEPKQLELKEKKLLILV